MKKLASFVLLPLCLFVQSCKGVNASHRSRAVVFIGDSITFKWGSEKAFQTHADWINKGISNENSSMIARRFQSDVIALHPRIVHILAGTNDVYPSWELCKRRLGEATPTSSPWFLTLRNRPDTCANMRYMVETAKRNGIRVILGTIPPWGCDTNPNCRFAVADKTPERYERIEQLNTWLKRFAAREHVQVIDYHAVLANPKGNYRDGLTEDGVHPSPAGFRVMQPLVEVKLK